MRSSQLSQVFSLPLIYGPQLTHIINMRRIEYDAVEDRKFSEKDIECQDSTSRLLVELQDVESQNKARRAAEQQRPSGNKIVILIAYFVLNLALTLSNKAVLRRVGPVHIKLLGQAHNEAGSISMAAHDFPHLIDINRLLPHDGLWLN